MSATALTAMTYHYTGKHENRRNRANCGRCYADKPMFFQLVSKMCACPKYVRVQNMRVSKRVQKWPKRVQNMRVSKNIEKISKNIQKYPKVSKTCPNVSKRVQKYPKQDVLDIFGSFSPCPKLLSFIIATKICNDFGRVLETFFQLGLLYKFWTRRIFWPCIAGSRHLCS